MESLETPITDLETSPHELEIEPSLRPVSFAQYIGQTATKDTLRVAIAAAKKRAEALEHVLIYGPPGLGKTSLAHVIARELGVNMRVTSGPAIERTGDLAAILTNLGSGDVLFIDEIHRLARPIEELLYPAMEDQALDLVIGKGPAAKTVRLDIPPFTLIGATTRAGSLSAPLRDRFGMIFHLEFYSDAEMQRIITRSARILELDLTGEAAGLIAKRSRGTPRIGNRLLRRVRDFADIEHDGVISLAVAEAALAALSIDQLGLDTLDRRLLQALVETFNGGPVGLNTLAAATSEEMTTVADVHEPYLLKQGFLKRTAAGRVATGKAWRHLGFIPPEGA